MCLVRYLLPSDHHTVRITKTDKYCVRKLDLKYIKFAKFKTKLKIRILLPLVFWL